MQEDPMSVRVPTHGARQSSGLLFLGTDLAEQFLITRLSVLQAWYNLCRLWILSPTYTSKFGLCRSLQPFSRQSAYSMYRNAGMLSKLIPGVDRGMRKGSPRFPVFSSPPIGLHRP